MKKDVRNPLYGLLLVSIFSLLTCAYYFHADKHKDNHVDRHPAASKNNGIEHYLLDRLEQLHFSFLDLADPSCIDCDTFMAGKPPKSEKEVLSCLGFYNRKFISQMLETMKTKLNDAEEKRKKIAGLKETEGLSYKNWMDKDLSFRAKKYQRYISGLENALRYFLPSLDMPVFTNIEQVISFDHSHLFNSKLNKIFSKFRSKESSKYLDNGPVEYLSKITERKDAQKEQSQDSADKLENPQSEEALDYLYDYIIDNDPSVMISESIRLVDGIVRDQHQSQSDELLFNNPDLVDIATSNPQKVQQWIKTQPKFKENWDKHIERTRSLLSNPGFSTDEETPSVFDHPKLAQTLLDEVDALITKPGSFLTQTSYCRYRTHLSDALGDNEERIKKLKVALDKKLKGPCAIEPLTIEESELIEKHMENTPDSLFYVRHSSDRDISQISNNHDYDPSACKSDHVATLGLLEAKDVDRVKDDLRYLKLDYKKVQQKYEAVAGATLSMDLNNVRTKFDSALSDEEKALFLKADQVDLSFLFGNAPHNQGKSYACYAYGITHGLEQAHFKGEKLIKPRTLSPAETYGLMLAKDLSYKKKDRDPVDLNSDDLHQEIFDALVSDGRKLGITPEQFTNLPTAKKEDVLVSHALKRGLTGRSLNILGQVPAPVEQGAKQVVRIPKQINPNQAGRLIRGFAHASYMSEKKPAISDMAKVLDQGHTIYIASDSSARRYYADWLQYGKSDKIGHIYQVVGYEMNVDPFDGKEKPAFKVRDSFCNASDGKCIDYYVSAEEMIPRVEYVMVSSQIEDVP